MRDETYRAAFAPESAAVRTTKFIRLLAPGKLDGAKYGHERTLGDAGVVPGQDADQNGDRAEIKHEQHSKSQADGFRNIVTRARFTRGDCYEFDPAKGVHRKRHGKQRGEISSGEESAVGRVLRSDAPGHEQCGAERR